MKICFWATSFQADNQALAVHLSQQAGVEILVALDEPARYQAEPVARLLPLGARLLDRQAAETLREIAAFAPDCVIVDNHLPKRRLAKRLYVLWHGYGWRVDDLSTMKRELRKLVGDVQTPNADFRWHAFGEQDRAYRVRHSGFAPENVVTLGSAYSDLLLPSSPTTLRLDPRSVQGNYEIDLSRPTILLGMTWHHGGALGHWGDDAVLHEELAQHVAQLGANLLIRMHDRHRYSTADAERMEALARRHPHVQLKFKSSHPDSLVDLLVSSVLVSNYSSLLNAFYYTGKPSIHIDPIAHDGPNFRRDWRWGMLRTKRTLEPMASWKLAPDDMGGIKVQSFAELQSALSRSVAQPDLCFESSLAFTKRHIALADGRALADGHSCERIVTFLRRWLAQ